MSFKFVVMEVVVGVIVLSQTAMLASEALFRRLENNSVDAPAPTSTAAPSGWNATSSNPRVRELEAQLAKLKAEARDANSPDEFVKYARLTREANKVEKELISIRGEEQATLPILEIMSSMMPTTKVATSARASTARFLLGFLPLVLLWGFFNYYSKEDASALIIADCDIFRPFAWVLHKVPANCSTETATCDAKEMCAIGYKAVAVVTNSVVARALSAIKSYLA